MNYSTLAWLSCCLLAVEAFTTTTSKTAFVGQPFAFRPSSSTSRHHAAWRMDLEEPFATTTSNHQEFLKRYQVPLPTLQTELQIPKVTTHHAAVDDEIDAGLAKHGLPWKSSIDTTHVVPSDSGLFYMPFFEWQLQFMKDNLTNLRVVPTESEATGEDLSYVEAVEERPCRMVTLCFASDEYRKIRMTVYDAGNRTQVFTSLWYPQPEYDLPVLGIDLLQFHQDRHLCVVDFQPLHDNQQESYEHLLEPIRSQYPSLQGQMTKRFYDETRFFSNQMLYSRFEELYGNKNNNMATTEEHPAYRDLFPAYQQYVQTHLNLLRSTTPQTENIPTVVKGQAAYDTYSADRDPAHAMFAKVFGQEFADAFVYDVLFAYNNNHNKSNNTTQLYKGRQESTRPINP